MKDRWFCLSVAFSLFFVQFQAAAQSPALLPTKVVYASITEVQALGSTTSLSTIGEQGSVIQTGTGNVYSNDKLVYSGRIVTQFGGYQQYTTPFAADSCKDGAIAMISMRAVNSIPKGKLTVSGTGRFWNDTLSNPALPGKVALDGFGCMLSLP